MGALLVPTYKESFRPPQFFIQCTWLTIYLCFIVVCLSCIFIHKYLCVCVCLRAHECMCGCVCMRHGCVWVGLEFNLGRFITEYKFQQLGSNGKTFNLSNKNILNAPKGFPILLLTLKSSLSIGQCPMTMSPFWYKYSLLAWKSAEAVLNITFMRHLSPIFFFVRHISSLAARQARLSKTFSFNPRQWKRIASFKAAAQLELEPEMELPTSLPSFGKRGFFNQTKI